MRYEEFGLAVPSFSGTPAWPDSDHDTFDRVWRPLPMGWECDQGETWVVLRGRGRDVLPKHRWKVHVPARLDNAERVLRAVCDYCFPRKTTFKFLRSRKILFTMTAMHASDRVSGRFVTIYPADYAELERALVDLSAELPPAPREAR